MSKPSKRMLSIVGMHRSMTSLATQWLHRCGLHVGDDLYGAGIGNLKGHFEDKDFIELHDYMLKINNTHWRDHTGREYQFDDYSKQKSSMLIRLKSELHDQWGWKDPRTCLFLDHWNGLLPNARYLIIYRPFDEVVDSLVRREFKVKNKAEYVFEWRKYISKYLNYNNILDNNLRLWIHYNYEIVQFISQMDKETFLVIRNDQLLNHSEIIYKHITEAWGFNLDYTSINSVFDSNITQKASIDVVGGVDKGVLKQAERIQSRLNELCFI